MRQLCTNVELCSLSVLGELIESNEISAAMIFSQLCGLDGISGRSAIENFRISAKRDAQWLEVLSTVNDHTLPKAMMRLLTDAFGLCELDAIDAVIRMQIAKKRSPASLN